MNPPSALRDQIRLPVIGAPMFLVSGPQLVVAQCAAGIIGTFPSLNARPQEQLHAWITRIEDGLAARRLAAPSEKVAPYGVNLIVHPSNPRWQGDLAICAERRVPLLITSLHAPEAVVKVAHAYGGLVFHDVTNVRHAKRALDAGADGLILVAAGAGGHAGQINPIALVNEIRAFYDGPLALSGCISHGKDILAAQVLGCDFAYMGTRFIATQESLAGDAYREMVMAAQAADVTYTPYFSGVPANYLSESILAAGLDPVVLASNGVVPPANMDKSSRPKAWKDVWSAGQGVGAVQEVLAVAELVAQLEGEYLGAIAAVPGKG
ncbi:NAD(P)H-dependent flavin oxidoreductase [Achromobacter mucicolens]|uniref:NAD(P)H-dependent flavin oxidoreductase n=1 Tax=Achromobacter mucicolens TaxID=1389922 RepID=UPI0021D2A9E4|nr:nitronate monooxygenase family protein [Achromobacter mucicolens]MCU6618992.1 nitronate monooxygenase family protein [Achromobacter mucicolens]MDH1525298.1 nitronate monooxygenase family protein [Achromobacter mucicolens]